MSANFNHTLNLNNELVAKLWEQIKPGHNNTYLFPYWIYKSYNKIGESRYTSSLKVYLQCGRQNWRR